MTTPPPPGLAYKVLDEMTTLKPHDTPESKAGKWALALVLAPTPVGHVIGLWCLLRSFFRWTDRRREDARPAPQPLPEGFAPIEEVFGPDHPLAGMATVQVSDFVNSTCVEEPIRLLPKPHLVAKHAKVA